MLRCVIQKLLMYSLLLIIIHPCSQAQDWPQWRGTNRDGVAGGFSAPQKWPEQLKPVWRASVGTGHSSPVVVGKKIYLHTRQEEKETVSSIDLTTGKVLWRESYPASYIMNSAAAGHGKGPKSTPLVHNGKLYTLGISGILSCFEIEGGKLLWRKEFSKQFPQTSPLFGTAMSPLVHNGLLIAHVGGHEQGALTAFSAETGAVKWSWKGDGPGYASPIIAEIVGTPQVVTQTQSRIVGVSAHSGELLWSIPFTTEYVQNIVTPVRYKEMLIFSGLSKGVMAIKVVKHGAKWTTEKVWENPEVSMYMNSPVIDGNYLYGMSHRNKGQFFCLDSATGKTVWTTQGREGENAAIVNAGDALFLLSNEAKLIVVKNSAKGFEPLARYSVAESPTWAHPIVLGSQILIKDEATLALWTLQ